MKYLTTLLLSIVLLLAACSDKPEKKTTEEPTVEVKVKKSDEAKKKIEEAKKRGKERDKTKDATTEEPSNEYTFDTERYNKARSCLIDASFRNANDCTSIQNTQEYSRAWNNLAGEGYLCQNGQCALPQQPDPQPETQQPQPEVQTEAPAQPQPQPQPETQVPQTENPIVPSELQTEQPLPDVQP